ncbi:uncharacterized protein LOC6561361 isoform X2 [Drosophila grimshawi]|uniref:uncharacterized protein LOC6561361 isoform X2 n=1 Tax=Drosophila grimshawi TaxID=7222 RepID=UPI000C86F02C|nr:uncharacterized protein LOC6561361 isoform X2 [Drosophila grimshawi]
MHLTVVLLCFALSLTALNALPWSPSDPMQPGLFQHYKNQKQRNLAKIQLLPRNAISFVGPRQATSVEEDEDDGYYDDDYATGNVPEDYADSEEDDYPWRR